MSDVRSNAHAPVVPYVAATSVAAGIAFILACNVTGVTARTASVPASTSTCVASSIIPATVSLAMAGAGRSNNSFYVCACDDF